jgi:large subunit ribosomal protein L28
MRAETWVMSAALMARSQITGKRRLRARHVSHSNIKTPRWQHVNVQRRRVWVPELNKFVTVKVTTRDLRTIDKVGLLSFAKDHGVKIA